MNTKVRNINTARKKNIQERALERDIAEICNCSVKMVQYVLQGKRTSSELADDIRVCYLLLSEKYKASKQITTNILKRA